MTTREERIVELKRLSCANQWPITLSGRSEYQKGFDEAAHKYLSETSTKSLSIIEEQQQEIATLKKELEVERGGLTVAYLAGASSRDKSLQEDNDELKVKLEEAIRQLSDIRKEDYFERIFEDQNHSLYEYTITTGMRKAWDGEPDLSTEGWEEYRRSERFEYHEEVYWRRKKSEQLNTKSND